MSAVRRRSTYVKAVLLPLLIAAVIWGVWQLVRRVDWKQADTRFEVAGETKDISFHVTAEDEDAAQAGIFASPDRLVDIEVSCSQLRQIGASAVLACPEGTLVLRHVAVSSVRLGDDTRVELSVRDRDLSMTFTQRSGQPPVVTLFANDRTKAGAGAKPLPTGNWTVRNPGPAVNVTFLGPHLDADLEEGGQTLSPGKALAFERDGATGFIGDSGNLTLLLPGNARKDIALRGDKLQVPSVTMGKVQSIAPFPAGNGGLQGLRIDVTGTSSEIDLIDTLAGTPRNVALDFGARHMGPLRTAKGIVSVLVTLLSGLAVIVIAFYDFRLKRREVGRSKTRSQPKQSGSLRLKKANASRRSDLEN